MTEEWRKIPNYNNYLISNKGRVLSLNYNHTKQPKLLKPLPLKRNGKIYYRVSLRENGIKKYFSIHRLVAEAFIPNPNNYPIINHMDENPSNNVYTNLEWCTYQYNNTYNNRAKKCGQKIGSKLKIKVCQYSLDRNLIKIWDGMVDIQQKLGYNKSNIWSCCNKKHKTAYGYIWKYYNKEEN